jgi:hypothetical protein
MIGLTVQGNVGHGGCSSTLVFEGRSPVFRQRGVGSASDRDALCDGEIELPDVTVAPEDAMGPTE